MNKAKRKDTPKPPRRQPLEEQASPELRSLIKFHKILPRGDWNEALAIKDRHGHESDIAKHVEKVWAESTGGKQTAFNAAMSFPARGYADIAAKIALARTDRMIAALEPSSPALIATFDGLLADVTRLANATTPDTADKVLLDLVSECEAALEVHKVLWARFGAERKEAERIAEATGYREAEGYSAGGAWQARHDFVKEREPTNSYERANEAHKTLGRAAEAVFAVKAQTTRGATAKLRIVIALINADELGTWQPVDRDWLAETLADFERLAEGATS